MPINTGRVRESNEDGEIGRVVKRRRPAKFRAPTIHKFVPDPPMQVSDAWAEAVIANGCKVEGRPSGHVRERVTPLLKIALAGVPIDSRWYLVAIAYSKGEASAFCSPLIRGALGHDIEAAYGPWPNKNSRGHGREHVILVRRHP